MFHFKKLTALLCISLLGISPTQADQEIITKFSEPGKICFPQTSLYAEHNKFNNVMLNHYLIVSKENHFKAGDAFIGFRLKNQPQTLWLYDGVNWINSNSTNNPPNAISLNPFTQLGQFLQPVIPISISNYPIDVSEYVGDCEVCAGYGLRSEEATTQESFDEMVNSSRFSRIWEIGGNIGNELTGPSIICLNITEITEIIPLGGHGHGLPDKVILDIDAVGTTTKP